MKVIKFGGSSLASAQQLTKVLNIVKTDNSRRIVVVSAPGKRNTQDTKVTDALIAYYKAYKMVMTPQRIKAGSSRVTKVSVMS